MNAKYYDLLMAEFPLRPLKSEEDLAKATTALNKFIDTTNLRSDDEDYMEVLGLIISDYDRKHHPMPEVSGKELIIHLLHASKLTQKAFAIKVGVPLTTLADVLSGRRQITPKTRRILATHFKMSEKEFV